MAQARTKKVALVYPGDRVARDSVCAESNRFPQVARELAAFGLAAEPAVYHDSFADEVRRQLLDADAALVWVNPIEEDRDRTVLDDMLRNVAAAGVFVSAHPDVVLKLGTKDVLFTTRSLRWGGDTHRYGSLDELRSELPRRLLHGQARVLKQYRGNGGNGVWKVELVTDQGSPHRLSAVPSLDEPVRIRHAKRGSVEQLTTLGAFVELCRPYFARDGRIIDQPYQPRLTEGMLRCYLVHDRVAGFGHQAINALYPAPPGAPPSDAPQPGSRLYYPPDKPEFQLAKNQLEGDWLPAAQALLGLSTDQLPVLWDVDLLLGPKDPNGNDTYVLCEINVSSVSPFPESAEPLLAEAVAKRLINH